MAQGAYQVAVNKTLGSVEVDWSSIRVICIAPGYKKYDLHAAEMMSAPIELWKYKNYENGIFNLEEIFSKKDVNGSKTSRPKKSISSKDEELPVYTYENHLNRIAEPHLKSLLGEIRDYTVSLAPKKLYIAYKTTKNFVCVETFKKKIMLYLKFTDADLERFQSVGRDVTNIGHFGTGNFEFTIKSEEDMETAKEVIRMAFENIGE